MWLTRRTLRYEHKDITQAHTVDWITLHIEFIEHEQTISTQPIKSLEGTRLNQWRIIIKLDIQESSLIHSNKTGWVLSNDTRLVAEKKFKRLLLVVFDSALCSIGWGCFPEVLETSMDYWRWSIMYHVYNMGLKQAPVPSFITNNKTNAE